MITNDAKYRVEIKFRIVKAKAAFNNKKIILPVKLPYVVTRNQLSVTFGS
jgi:hypothetical protein